MRPVPFLIAAIPALLLAQHADAAAGMTLQGQEQDQWCWAASTNMVMSALPPGGGQLEQCKIVDKHQGKDTCCDDQAACNQPAATKDAMSKWYSFTSMDVPGNVLTINGIKTETDAGRPVPFSYGWNGGGGHAMVINNVFLIFTTGFIEVYNPWPVGTGEVQYIGYDEWLGGDDYDHKLRWALTNMQAK